MYIRYVFLHYDGVHSHNVLFEIRVSFTKVHCGLDFNTLMLMRQTHIARPGSVMNGDGPLYAVRMRASVR